MAKGIDAEIDRLYQLPLDEFTAARNALAKSAGADAARVRVLQKPPVAAWAVNQLFWRERDVYDRLAGAVRDLQAAHKAVAAGRKADLRAVGKVHEEALEAAVKTTVDLMQSSGHPVTDATRQAIISTLRALPGEDEPGRLTRTLQPGGFEMLAGIPVGARSIEARRVEPRPARNKEGATTIQKPKVDARAVTRARESAAAAARAAQAAEHTARREEFEAARAARDADKAERAVERAREALADAERALADAQRDAEAAAKAREAAERRAREADAALQKARSRAEEARQELVSMTG
jgi:hypothetical protein